MNNGAWWIGHSVGDDLTVGLFPTNFVEESSEAVVRAKAKLSQSEVEAEDDASAGRDDEVGDGTLLKRVLSFGVPVDSAVAPDCDGSADATPFHVAAAAGADDLQRVGLLKKKKKNKVVWNARSSSSSSSSSSSADRRGAGRERGAVAARPTAVTVVEMPAISDQLVGVVATEGPESSKAATAEVAERDTLVVAVPVLPVVGAAGSERVPNTNGGGGEGNNRYNDNNGGGGPEGLPPTQQRQRQRQPRADSNSSVTHDQDQDQGHDQDRDRDRDRDKKRAVRRSRARPTLKVGARRWSGAHPPPLSASMISPQQQQQQQQQQIDRPARDGRSTKGALRLKARKGKARKSPSKSVVF